VSRGGFARRRGSRGGTVGLHNRALPLGIAFGGQRAEPGIARTHRDLQRDYAADLGFQRRENPLLVMRLDPAFEEPGRNGKKRAARLDGLEPQAAEPAREDVFAQFRAQALAATFPGIFDRSHGD